MALAVRRMVSLYNFLARRKELLRPAKPGRVGLYTCGPTVYNYAHIGNLRTYIFEDILRRTLALSGYTVRQVMNLTDVDDKTIKGSKAKGQTLKAFTAIYAEAFFRDIRKLNILPAWKYPRATSHVKDMVRLISVLLKKKLAYQTRDGVYFDISKFRPYGKLSRVRTRKLKPGARVAADEYSKAEASDFALWKAKKPGEPSWLAPFGRGRPGWHIECSAMAMKYLGPTFDIHAGGVDLLFPHHEDEIAQSEGATGKPFVRYFVEGEHLLVDGRKMAKSLGNIYRLADLEKKGFGPLDFRYFVLGAHYRTPLNFTWKALGAARTARAKIMAAVGDLKSHKGKSSLKDENEVLKVIAFSERQFRSAIGDDLNIPKALAVLNELIHYANTLRARGRLSSSSSRMILAAVKEFDRVLGLDLLRVEKMAIPKRIKALVAKRGGLRRARKWQEADRLREQIKKLGFSVEDTAAGPRVRTQR
ncbi:MAG: cysteine--tRNA ligase [Candidatus Sungbacteria bacterium]|uniref:Cysteine--tRNA ligase n=1 Tax=Candidatus Sungiibacteriota bacterium TaxID=2750080 RepID=A0A932YWA0_9BACT|nr:cysteine--tRNA ligase [Candidatus Sungbacteria bacterium]